MKFRIFLLAAAALPGAAGPAAADGWLDWNVQPFSTQAGELQLTAGGTVYGSVFMNDQPRAPGLGHAGITGASSVYANVARIYDSGLSISLKSVFEIYHDKLSGDNYGSDFVQKVYGVVQTGLGRVELGNTDGAAYTLAITGPTVDPETTIDNSNATFFRDPTTGTAFTDIFALNSAVESSLNYAKISYYTPRLFGLELAASYTPSEGKDVLPFLSKGPHAADRQQNIWEAAANYTTDLGPVSLGFYGALSGAHDGARTFGHEGLSDWALGAQADYAIDDETKLSLGGAFRRANSYAFNINDVLASGETTSAHLSTMLTCGAWTFGGEYGDGTAEGSLGAAKLGVRAYQIAAGYALNANLTLSGGWQRLHYSRDSGAFYNGAPEIQMNAGFVHLRFQI